MVRGKREGEDFLSLISAYLFENITNVLLRGPLKHGDTGPLKRDETQREEENFSIRAEIARVFSNGA